MIVHNGGEAKVPLPLDRIDFSEGEFYDPWFMKKYPQFVDQLDNVAISEKQLNCAVTKSVELVNHAAKLLREKQIEAIKKEREEAKQKKP